MSLKYSDRFARVHALQYSACAVGSDQKEETNIAHKNHVGKILISCLIFL